MKALIDRLLEFERRIALERSPFVLLGLFRSTEESGTWDVIVSAHWINPRSIESFRYLAERLTPLFSSDPQLLNNIGGIAPFPPDSPFVRELLDLFPVKPIETPRGLVKGSVRMVKNTVVGGIPVYEGYIITCEDDVNTPRNLLDLFR